MDIYRETVSTGVESNFDLLHALKDVESDHRISAECGVRGSDKVLEHSSLTGRRGYALVALSQP